LNDIVEMLEKIKKKIKLHPKRSFILLVLIIISILQILFIFLIWVLPFVVFVIIFIGYSMITGENLIKKQDSSIERKRVQIDRQIKREAKKIENMENKIAPLEKSLEKTIDKRNKINKEFTAKKSQDIKKYNDDLKKSQKITRRSGKKLKKSHQNTILWERMNPREKNEMLTLEQKRYDNEKIAIASKHNRRAIEFIHNKKQNLIIEKIDQKHKLLIDKIREKRVNLLKRKVVINKLNVRKIHAL